MMMAVVALPNEAQRRLAPGSLPRRPNTVLVKDGDGTVVGRIHPGSRYARGRVVTTTGDVNLASGYYDPARPGLVANLRTTLQPGRQSGRVRVWGPGAARRAWILCPQSERPAASGHSAPPQAASAGRAPPSGHRTRQAGPGRPRAWGDPRTPTYVSINDEGVVSRVEPRTTAGGALRVERAPRRHDGKRRHRDPRGCAPGEEPATAAEGS